MLQSVLMYCENSSRAVSLKVLQNLQPKLYVLLNLADFERGAKFQQRSGYISSSEVFLG